jgi:superfamily II DNA/RNA helicase
MDAIAVEMIVPCKSSKVSAAVGLQVLMFSATLHDDEVKRLAGQLCTTPTWVDLKGKDAVPETVDHMVALVSSQKDRSWGAAQVCACMQRSVSWVWRSRCNPRRLALAHSHV